MEVRRRAGVVVSSGAAIIGAVMREGEANAGELGSTQADDAGSLTPSQELGSLGSVLLALARTESATLAPGTLVADQYRIVRSIGEGGMGVVFLAHDVRLGRNVAVKLCTGLAASAVHRIQREALALAKLAHPNVVVVFQAGELDGRFFIAMEYVAGGTARSWVAAAPRQPREIVALYVAAGEGLAAAHAAGLVHRDFKPDNVLVGEDGRPRVADFGLVRAAREPEREPEASRAAPSGGTRHDGATLVTKAGTVMGTPAYMPPEQLAGAELDARADQYSFAASLWEALMGWRPAVGGMRSEGTFAGDSASSVRASASAHLARAAGETEREVPRHVPHHVVAALRRALSERPADRFPELGALLLELRRDPAATRRRVALGVAALGLTAAVSGVVVLAVRDEGPAPCEDGPARIESVWNAERSAALAKVVGATAWPAIEARIRPRTDAWLEVYAQACRATAIEAVADEATLHRRMLCLESRRDELDATLAALQSGSRTVVANAAEALDLLPASAACLDADAGATVAPLPSDPAVRVEIAAAQRAVTEASAAWLDPALLEAAGKAERAVALARATGWAPVIAEALIVRGAIAFDDDHNEDAVSAYEEAMHLALASGSDAIALRSHAGMAWPLAELHRLPEATRALATARALWERIGRPSFEERLLLGAEAHVALRDERPRDALAKTREQIAVSERMTDLPATVAASNQYNLALALDGAGELEDAMAAAMKAVAVAREPLGDEHPTIARYQALAAKIAGRRGDYDTSVELAARALEINDRWYGSYDARLAISLEMLADAARRRGRVDEAMALYHRNLGLHRSRDGELLQVPKLEANLAIATVELGDFAGAAPLAARALAGLERRYGPDDPSLVQALVLTGYIARERPEPDLAGSARDLERALAIAEAKLGRDHTETINTEIELANTQVAMGQAPAAVERLERRLAQLQRLELPRHQPAELRYALARALAATGQTARACTLAGQAEAGLRALTLDSEPVTQWRVRHCPG